MTTDITSTETSPLTAASLDHELTRAVQRVSDDSMESPVEPHHYREASHQRQEIRHKRDVGWVARTTKRMSRWWYRRLRGRRFQRWVSQVGWDRPVTLSTFTSTNQAAPLDPLLVETRTTAFGALHSWGCRRGVGCVGASVPW